jgi:hypothetical protein
VAPPHRQGENLLGELRYAGDQTNRNGGGSKSVLITCTVFLGKNRPVT